MTEAHFPFSADHMAEDCSISDAAQPEKVPPFPAAGMSRDDAESLVFDLLDAARSFDQAETAFRRGAREYYEEMRDKVISALSIPHRSSGETK